MPDDDAAIPPTPEPPREEPSPTVGDRLMALFEVAICSGFPTQLALAWLFAALGFSPFLKGGRLSADYVFVLLLSDSVLLVGLVAWLLHLHDEHPAAVLLGFPRRSFGRELLLGALLTPVVFVVMVVLLSALHAAVPWLHNVTRNPLENLMGTAVQTTIFALVAFVSGGVKEEIQRGFVLHRFRQYLGGGGVGLVVFSLVFGAGHVIQGWDAAVTTGTLGLLWGAVYLWRRSIIAPVVSHSAFDITMIVQFVLMKP